MARYIKELCRAMVFEQIDRIKREYTDKYVVVDDGRPELARFKGVVGQVKTVNMSGRALVEFNEFHKNIGWYDIDIDYLKVVDKPAPREKVAKERPRPAAKKRVAAEASPSAKKLSPLEMARLEGAAKKKGARPTSAASSAPASAATDRVETTQPPAATKRDGGKMSVAEILAAARGAKTSETVTAAAKETKTFPPAADAQPAPAQPPTKVEPGKKMPVADILAAARAEKRAAAPVASPPDASPPEQAPSQPASANAAHQEPTGEAAEQATKSEADPGSSRSPAVEQTTPAAAPRGGKVDRSRMSVAEIVAWCREHDG